MSDVVGMYVQGHMPIMWNVCILVLLVTLLIVLRSYEVHILTYLSDIYTCTSWHMWHLSGIFVVGTYMAIAW